MLKQIGIDALVDAYFVYIEPVRNCSYNKLFQV